MLVITKESPFLGDGCTSYRYTETDPLSNVVLHPVMGVSKILGGFLIGLIYIGKARRRWSGSVEAFWPEHGPLAAYITWLRMPHLSYLRHHARTGNLGRHRIVSASIFRS
jgi:hypothetical protein